MGVIYKLKPEVIEFILESKRSNPALGCRSLAVLAEGKFQTKLSKSSINSVIKQSGLSMPVGRRRKIKRNFAEADQLGSVILKAMDSILGGMYSISDLIKGNIKLPPEKILCLNEYLLYSPLFDLTTNAKMVDSGLWNIINDSVSQQEISSYLVDLKELTQLRNDLLESIRLTLKQVRCFKVTLEDGTNFFIDGQMHTLSSTPETPLKFGFPIFKARKIINDFIAFKSPLILFMAPGYDEPTGNFLEFMHALRGLQGKGVSAITLISDNLEEIENMKLQDEGNKYQCIFGLWPWQFQDCRKITLLTDFKQKYVESLKEELFVAEAEFELWGKDQGDKIQFKGCAIKKEDKEEIRVYLLTNIKDNFSLDILLDSHFGHWQGIENAFSYYISVIQGFAENKSFLMPFSFNTLELDPANEDFLTQIFGYYLKILAGYLVYYFLPSEYAKFDFSTIKKRFFDLKAIIKAKSSCISVIFKVSQDYEFSKDLLFLCRRLNSLELSFFSEDKPVFFTVNGL